MKRLIFLLVSLSMSTSVSVSVSVSMSMPTSRTWTRTWKRILTETGTRTGTGHGHWHGHGRWSDIVDRCWKNGNNEATFCLQDRTLKRWSDIIASKCLILKRSFDNFAYKIKTSDDPTMSDHRIMIRRLLCRNFAHHCLPLYNIAESQKKILRYVIFHTRVS